MKSSYSGFKIRENPDSSLYKTSIAFNKLLIGVEIKKKPKKKKIEPQFDNPYERAIRNNFNFKKNI